MLSLKLHFSKFWAFKCFYLAMYWPHNDHDESWQHTAHVNVSVANFSMLCLFIVLFKLINWCRKVVISDGDCFTSPNTYYNVLWPTNLCVKIFMTLCGKIYDLLYTTTRVSSLLTVIWENILMRWLSAKNMIFCSSWCWSLIERALENELYSFSNWIFIIVYVCIIDIWYSFCHLYTQRR